MIQFSGPFDLSKTPIHLGSAVGAHNPAVPLPGFTFDGQAFETYIAEHCTPGVGPKCKCPVLPEKSGHFYCALTYPCLPF
jgi:hypothetical protein